jgi:DMSO reductase anchor subunit
MAKLKDKITNALDESRILILGTQVLVGFQYRSTFESGFEKLPLSSQYLRMGTLGLMLITLALLLSPGAYHRIVEKGEDTENLHRFTTSIMDWALLPFAVGLGIDLYIAIENVTSRTFGIISGFAATLVALFFWYGLETIHRRAKHKHATKENRSMRDENEELKPGGTELKDKIRHVLIEARMVLPGAQALLGFQFAIILLESFDKLPVSSKYVHLASLALIALSIIVLMTPAAYHRIVEQGEDTEHFHRFASRMVLAAMVPLALGVSGDFFVVVRKVTESSAFAISTAGVMLVFFYGLWFGFTIYRRNQPGRLR